MSSIVVLQDIELIPVLKFEPFQFAAEGRSPPFGFYERMPEEWHRHWVESLADSGIRGVMPVERGSWHVPTSEFTDLALLRRVLEVIFQNMEEAGFSIDLDCLPLLGGLALRQSRTVLKEMGLDLPPSIDIRVWDTTADTRYMVLPVRPAGTEGWSEEKLASLVTKDAMIGVARL